MEKKIITVALLSGGTSSEREVSLSGGDHVYHALDKNRYNVFRYDPKTEIAQLIADARKIDVALIILHGAHGEDGTVQGLLDLLNIPYQCSGPLGSSVAINKLASKHFYAQCNIPTPTYMTFRTNDSIDADTCISRLGLPIVVKPVSGGSSIGMTIAHSKNDLIKALDKAFEYDDTVLLEEYIKGTEITGAVIGNKNPEALPIVEIVPNDTYEFFDYQAKYTAGETEEICPARISEKLTKRAWELAKKSHSALFCKGCSRTDMIIKGEDIYVLETNTIPGMTASSLLPLAAEKAGMNFSQLIDRLIELGLEEPVRNTGYNNRS
ncbi:MAG: D-alanine--D-alanine ligase [Desulfobacteraceae bacterium]|nr:D-alanine--D-alanine ligase [Desulfobacteraceae bacterium]MBC2756606.1 D-alanine--D-alanine ligase [Desulfobacteraceae bacterium]